MYLILFNALLIDLEFKKRQPIFISSEGSYSNINGITYAHLKKSLVFQGIRENTY